MAMTAAELVKADQEHLIHPLHHPIDNAEPMIYVRGRGATIQEIGGHEYIDGLSGLWNVNVGHGRAELADAAAAQMKDLAYFSGYVGSSNIPAITLANKLIELAYDNMQAVFFTCGGAESNESAFKTARFYWKTQGKPDKVKIISRQQGYHGVTLQAMSATGMGAYWKMFEPRVPGFIHIQTCYPYRFQGAKAGETVGRRPRASSRRRSCARGRTPWPDSSASPFTAAAASSIRPTTTGRGCVRCARATRCC